MSDIESEDLDFEYYVRQGSMVDVVRYDRNRLPRDKATLNLADTMTFHIDEFMASFKDTISGSIFMRFERHEGTGSTSLTTKFQNVYMIDEGGDENECFFFDDDVDEVIAYHFAD